MTTSLRWPWMTHVKYLGRDYVGIVQNQDAQFLHMYVIENSWSADQKMEFVNCGELYWWGSNRQIPINVFLGLRFKPFRASLKSFSMKEVQVLSGPTLSLDTLVQKRTKKRTVQLVKHAQPPEPVAESNQSDAQTSSIWNGGDSGLDSDAA